MNGIIVTSVRREQALLVVGESIGCGYIDIDSGT
jgi:hypothetical protein